MSRCPNLEPAEEAIAYQRRIRRRVDAECEGYARQAQQLAAEISNIRTRMRR
jgi:hypothetical protein